MEIQWPLILFTFFNCLAGGIFLMQGILTLSGKGKAMQLASCISAIVALAIGGLSVFFHLQHPLRMLNGFGHITSGITIELIFVIVFAIAVVLYFLMMRRSEEGVAPKWCAVLAIVVSLALPFATGDSYLMSAIPVWDTMLLPLYYVVATVMLGGLAAMIIAGATKADDAVKLSATVAFVGAPVRADHRRHSGRRACRGLLAGQCGYRLRGACRAGGPGDDGQDSRREGPGCGGGCPGVRRDRHHRVARAALRSGRERPHPVPVGALARG